MGRRRCLGAAALAAALLGGCAPTGEAPDTGGEPVTDAPTGVPSSALPTPSATPSVPSAPSPTLPEDPVLGSLASMAEERATGLGRSTEPVLGADISWPQCPKGMGIPERPTQGMPMPVPDARYVVIGLTNGPAYTRNPCLADQVAWARERGLLASAYSVLSLPSARELRTHGQTGPYDGSSRLGALANAGYQQAVFNVQGLQSAGLPTPIVWLDVEPVPDFDWGADLEANAAVVEGAARGYREAGYRIGVYSTPYLWERIVGDLALGLPEWRAAGQTSRQEALSRCGEDWSIQGGQPVLAQWVADDRDHNVTCPDVDVEAWFHQL